MASRWRSVRTRTTVAVTSIVAVTLTAAAFTFVWTLERSVVENAATAAETEAERIEDGVDERGAAAFDMLGDDELVQLFDASGTIVATSPRAEGLRLREGRATIDGEPYLVVVEDFEGDAATFIALAYEIEDGLEIAGEATGLLMIAVPALVGLVAALTWFATGRALAPVQRIRREVDAIEATGLDHRVAVPRTGDEIAHLAETMNHMLGRLDAAARSQSQFVADAAHELRSPLATLRQHAEVAALHPDAVPTPELAETVLAEVRRLHDLVEALLLLARLDENAERTDRHVDLDDLVFAEASRRRGSIAIDTSRVSAARARGDERLLAQIIRNLVDNATRHAQSRVTVSLDAEGDTVTLRVEDDGTGIDPADRERVFERFVRLDEARARDDGGAGLGLAIVAGIVAAHGGSVAAEASREGGAAFRVTLPAA